MKRIQPMILAVAAVLILTELRPAAAQHSVFQYQVDLSVNNLVDTKVNYELGPGPIDLTLTDPGVGSAQGTAYVGYGVNKTYSRIHSADADNPIWLAYSLGTAQWWDTVTISDPLLDGTRGYFTTRLYVEGAGHFDISDSWRARNDVVEVSGQWLATVWVGGEGLEGGEHNWNGSWGVWFPERGLEYVGDPLNAYSRDVTFQFIYGQPFDMGGMLQTYLNVQNYTEFLPGTIDAEIDLGNSAYWGGMTAIRDARFRRNPRARLASLSGIDWTKSLRPVPEPSTLTLISCGGAALWWFSKRRGTRAQKP